MDDNHDDKDQNDEKEKVGYGKPPKPTQYKPGQSGNPMGRPPKRKTKDRLLKDLLFEKRWINQNGKRRKLPRLEICIYALLQKVTQNGGHVGAFKSYEKWSGHISIITEGELPTLSERARGGIIKDSQYYEYLNDFGLQDPDFSAGYYCNYYPEFHRNWKKPWLNLKT